MRACARVVASAGSVLAGRAAAADHGGGATPRGWSLEIWLFGIGVLIVLLMAGWALWGPEREDADDEETKP